MPTTTDSAAIPQWLTTGADRFRLQLSTREGLQEFIEWNPRRPRISLSRYEALSARDRMIYNESRAGFHRSLVLVRHAQLDDAWDNITDIVSGASDDSGAGNGVAMTGGPQFGKTSIAAGFAREYVRERMDLFPEAWEQEIVPVPVAYCNLLPGVGLRANMEHILRFYGERAKPREKGVDLMDRVGDLLRLCATRLLILDQAQNLNSGDRRDAEVANYIKHLMDYNTTVIMLVGLDLDTRGPLAPSQSRRRSDQMQLASRFRFIKIEALESDDPEWRALLASIEARLTLYQARAGDLSDRLADTIWEHTAGSIGSTFMLCAIAANRAIRTGDERITNDLLRRAARTLQDEIRRRG